MNQTILNIAFGLLSFLIAFIQPSFAQDMEKEGLTVDGKEKVFALGINLTNRGWGFNTYYGIGNNQYQWLIGVDLHSVKDSRETLIEPFSKFQDQGKKYIYGKQNYLYVFTPSVGFQRNLIPAQGGNLLNVRVGGQIGPAIGLLNPYSVEIFDPVPNNNNNPGQNYFGYRVIEPFNPEKHDFSEIIGRASILSAKPELSAQFGLSLRTHVLMDFTRSHKYIGGFQLTLDADYFLQPVPIMAQLDEQIQNRKFFLAGSLGLVFGNRWQ